MEMTSGEELNIEEHMYSVVLTLEPSRIGVVSPDLSIDLDKTLLDNSSDFSSSQCILQSVPQKHCQRQRFTEFVGTGRWAGSVGPAEFVEHP